MLFTKRNMILLLRDAKRIFFESQASFILQLKVDSVFLLNKMFVVTFTQLVNTVRLKL